MAGLYLGVACPSTSAEWGPTTNQSLPPGIHHEVAATSGKEDPTTTHGLDPEVVGRALVADRRM